MYYTDTTVTFPINLCDPSWLDREVQKLWAGDTTGGKTLRVDLQAGFIEVKYLEPFFAKKRWAMDMSIFNLCSEDAESIVSLASALSGNAAKVQYISDPIVWPNNTEATQFGVRISPATYSLYYRDIFIRTSFPTTEKLVAVTRLVMPYLSTEFEIGGATYRHKTFADR